MTFLIIPYSPGSSFTCSSLHAMVAVFLLTGSIEVSLFVHIIDSLYKYFILRLTADLNSMFVQLKGEASAPHLQSVNAMYCCLLHTDV